MTKKRAIIKVFGIVQGVGFRPFIHKLVNLYGFKGWVNNSASGVTIDIEGEENELIKFTKEIHQKAPQLAVIEDISVVFDHMKDYTEFKILKSDLSEEGFVLISPDVSTCSDCYSELMDPDNKRNRYPFTNCTNCGPRFTIIKQLPYDRDKTTMDKFSMCMNCDNEYHDIENRRYHAQPNCCPDCGPQLELIDSSGNKVISVDEINTSIQKLLQGNIVAIKGLGGFHLACNALNDSAVKELRIRKKREEKPFAIMCRDVESAKKYACVSESEKKILEGITRPIVLLKKVNNCKLSPGVAPDTDYLGIMLPYTPLHYLLFQDNDLEAVVMTSANISDNPVIIKNNDAIKILGEVADYFLCHNREINTRCDDSLVKVIEDKEYFIRRSRGYAPFPIKLEFELKPILACGAEQKASFSISKGRYVFISQHIGDLKNYDTLVHYEEQIENYKKLFKIEPSLIACDMHPDYLSTNYANSIEKIEKRYIQHHHAHMASCMADNNLNENVIGITWDGTGLGTDNTSWGGEILVGNYLKFRRMGSFLQTPMPGGDSAVKDIYKMAVSYLASTYGIDFAKYIDLLPHLKDKNINHELMYSIISRGINSPNTSSCGRLFDGVSSILGLCNIAAYEGQGAIKLESITDFMINDILELDIIKVNDMYIYDWRSTIDNIIRLFKSKKDISYIASAFHNTLVEAAVRQCSFIRDATALNKVTLSGGVFQNSFILLKMMKKLKGKGFDVYIHGRVSSNDEGLSLGQLIIAQNGGGVNVSCSTA